MDVRFDKDWNVNTKMVAPEITIKNTIASLKDRLRNLNTERQREEEGYQKRARLIDDNITEVQKGIDAWQLLLEKFNAS